ncbi:MAG TPA: Ig-like domain-containing protein, partial [Acidimicrobiia bacterium]
MFVPGEVMDVTARDRVAYISAYTGSLQVVDFTNPAAPVVVPPGAQGFVPRDFEMAGRFGIAAEQVFPNIVAIVELSNPLAPVFSSTIDFEPLADYAGTGIALDASYVYMVGESFFVFQSPYGTTGNTGLFIGKYLEVSDEAGVAPTVNITSPAAGSEHIAGSTVTVHAEATDDVGVAGVTFSVDGVPFSTDFIAPFELSFTLPANVTSVTFGASATDFGGNVGTAPTITIQVIPDPAPTVTITSPADGASVIEGQTLTLTATATDNVSVRQVSFTVNGTTLTPVAYDQPSVTTSQSYVVGVGVSQLAITASATDNLGQTGSASRTVTVVPDPKTTVTGRVIDTQLLPVADANVSAFGVSSHSGADGTFTIPNVPTARGNIVVSADKLVDGETLSGTSEAVPPVRGGTTDVGTIQLTSLHLQPDGTLLDRARFVGSFDDGFARVDLPFPFTLYGVAYDHVFVGTNGYLTFVNGDSTYNANVNSFNNQPRIAVFFSDLETPQSGANGIFVNTDVSGRFVVTWRNVHACCGGGTPMASFQIVLNADGRIQFGYDGVQVTNAVVGITPGQATTQTFDFTQTPVFSVDAQTAPYQIFNGRFGLDHAFLTFTPNAGGGYDGQFRIAPPTVILTSPVAGATLVQGESITMSATASAREPIAEVDFSVNGLPLLPDSTSPYNQSFQVPLGVASLTFTATAIDINGQSVSTSRVVSVVPDSPTTVRGTVVDESNNPVSGATIALDQSGLKGEFFNFDGPLPAMPDLTSLTPTSVRLVSSLDFRNPGQMFNADTFGMGLAPYFAARFTGLIRIDAAGEYRFYLAADDGATLRIDGTTVVTVAGGGTLVESSGIIALTAGTHPIDVQYFQNTGDAQLQLSYAPPAAVPQRQTIQSSAFVISPAAFSSTTDDSGAF